MAYETTIKYGKPKTPTGKDSTPDTKPAQFLFDGDNEGPISGNYPRDNSGGAGFTSHNGAFGDGGYRIK